MGVDVVDVREVRLELVVGEDNELVDVEELVAPGCEVRGINYDADGVLAMGFVATVCRARGTAVQGLTRKAILGYSRGREDAKLTAATGVGLLRLPGLGLEASELGWLLGRKGRWPLVMLMRMLRMRMRMMRVVMRVMRMMVICPVQPRIPVQPQMLKRNAICRGARHVSAAKRGSSRRRHLSYAMPRYVRLLTIRGAAFAVDEESRAALSLRY